MEYSIVGPLVFGLMAAILTMGIVYFSAVREGALPPQSFLDGFGQWVLIIVCGAAMGVLSGVASDKDFFNADYFAQMKEDVDLLAKKMIRLIKREQT